MNFGSDRERARDADALALAARELVRIAVRVIGLKPDELEQLADALVDRLCPSRARGCAAARR